MDDKLTALFKTNRVFSLLDETARNKLAPLFTEIQLNPNEVLFYQGDTADSVFVLVSGKLAAELTSISGETRSVGFLHPGEIVGEIGALFDEPRSLTIKAVKPSTLFSLPAKDFAALCQQYPAVMYAAVSHLVTRSRNTIQMLSAEKTNKHIVVVPANKEILLDNFAEKLIHYAERYPNILIISDYQPEFSDDNITPDTIREKLQRLLLDRKHTYQIIYILKSPDTALAKVAFKKADSIYVTADRDVTPQIDRVILEKIEHLRPRLRSDAEFILLHPEGTFVPRNTAIWLRQAEFFLYHHVRIDNVKDFARLLRFMRNRATGIVLSGGGTRGWAHLGAIKAIQEAKIPIDFIGGTSVGAFIAACYARHQSYEQAYEDFYKLVVESNHSVSWRSLTWPAISLFNAKSYTLAQMEIFGDLHIEDLWLPFFCVSCNLAKSSEEIHRQGILWERTRASSSIPGIIPPMLLNGEIHLDGGLLNNLPVDIMRQYVGNKGKIIAIELNNATPSTYRKYFFPPILTFKDALLAKIGLGKNNYRFPRFIDTFLRGLFVGSMNKAKQNGLAANIFVSLDLGKFRLLQSNPNQANRLIDIGYQETLKQIHYSSIKGES